MDITELRTSAETELRDAILSEFLKPEMPLPVTLLRHCERYLITIFDAHAERLFNEGPAPDDYGQFLKNMVHNLPVSFFGYSYAAPGTQPASGLGFLWGRCIEYVMLALVDHGPEPQPSEHEILGRYLAINGHLFLSYGLQTRADFWLSKAHEGLPSTNSGATTESHCDESTFSTGGAAVHGTNVKETEPSENEPTLLEAVLALDGPGRIGEARRAAVDAYIGEVFRQTGKRITRTDIWKTVRYKTRTEFERWERNDPKNPNKTADARFRKILTEKPHLK